MHTKATILLTVLMVGAGGCASSTDEGEASTLATLGVDLRDPAVRAEWEATCAALAGDAAVPDASIPAPVEDAAVDGDDDADEVAEESAGRGDRDRTSKICDYLDGGRGHWRGGRGRHHDHDRDHDEHRGGGGRDEDCGAPDRDEGSDEGWRR